MPYFVGGLGLVLCIMREAELCEAVVCTLRRRRVTEDLMLKV